MTQQEALDILKMGHNVFLTGPAGSGKTYVLNEYIEYLKSHAVSVAVTASTGIASTHLGGMTIHSWSGLGVRENITDADIDELMERSYLYKRFEKTKVLVIDEISMLHSYRLNMLEWVCRQFKRNEKPFGGLQVIVCGDFFQLPPVSRGDTPLSHFAYTAESWDRARFTVCYLSEQHRQKDSMYLSVLNAIRGNTITEDVRALLESRLHKEPEGGMEPTRLYTHNIDVDSINQKHLAVLSGSSKRFAMVSVGSPALVETLRKSCLSPEVLELKVGARVMFTKNNQEAGYVNGTLGKIDSFNSFGQPVVRTVKGELYTATPSSWTIEEEGKVKAEISQLPLRLAWAITVHKSQGMSLDAMEVDLTKSFVRGMGYVALSRVRSLSGMKLLGYNELSLQVDADVLEKDLEFQEMSEVAAHEMQTLGEERVGKIQKTFLKSIEPDEKTKIKKLEKATKKSTEELTLELLEEKLSLKKIAEKRGLKQETIITHIEKIQEERPDLLPDISYLKKEFAHRELDRYIEILEKTQSTALAPVFHIMEKKGLKPTYAKLRLAKLFLH